MTDTLTKDDLGDRMKAYEAVETDRAFDPALPLVVRLDGRAFSTFTRGMEKPFDHTLSRIMREVTAHLVEKNHARIGYTQSDEITLLFHRDSEETRTYVANAPNRKSLKGFRVWRRTPPGERTSATCRHGLAQSHLGSRTRGLAYARSCGDAGRDTLSRSGRDRFAGFVSVAGGRHALS